MASFQVINTPVTQFGDPNAVTCITQSSATETLPPGTVVVLQPQPVPGVPPGLEYLLTLDQLLIYQLVDVPEVAMRWSCRNRYQIKNNTGLQVYFVREESGICMRQCCKTERGFILHIADNFGQEVIRVSRRFKCCAGCCWCADADCCGWELQVEAPVGNICGYVRQIQSNWRAQYMIRDADGQDVLFIRQGPCCICAWACCTADVEFKVFTLDESREVGVLSRQYAGCEQECFTNANNFNVSFPIDLDVRMKAVVLAAAFLIDFMFFEFMRW